MKEFGIDVSQYQGKINWDKVKEAGVQFAILRIGYTNNSTSKRHYKDTKFDYNYEECKRLGIKTGVYYRSCATTFDEGRKDAQLVLDWLKGKSLEIGIFDDVETRCFTDDINKVQITEGVKGFCGLISANNWIVGTYSNLDFLKNRIIMSELDKYELWCAAWSTVKPTSIREHYMLWQFGGERNSIRDNHLDGITENVVDMNYLYIDYMDKIKREGLNGYPKEELDNENNINDIIEDITNNQESICIPNIDDDKIEDIIEENIEDDIMTDAAEKEIQQQENIKEGFIEKIIIAVKQCIKRIIRMIKGE